jgi:hypothetical protein
VLKAMGKALDENLPEDEAEGAEQESADIEPA